MKTFSGDIGEYLAQNLKGAEIRISGHPKSPSFMMNETDDYGDSIHPRWVRIVSVTTRCIDYNFCVEIETSEGGKLAIFPEYTITLRKN